MMASNGSELNATSPGNRRGTPPGPWCLDAGLASLAGFLTTLYAARFLEPAALGAYSLYFGGFIFAGMIPAQLYFLPAQVAAIESPARNRISIVRTTLTTGSP